MRYPDGMLSPLALLFLLIGCGSASPAPDPAPAPVPCRLVEHGHGPDDPDPLDVRVVVRGLQVPWSLAFTPDGGMLITERPGRLRRVDPDGTLVAEPLLTLDVATSGEAGLLGLALDPDFASNRWLVLYESRTIDGATVNRVVRYRLAADARHVELERVIVDGIPGAKFHDGGRLRFGPDHLLYVGTGDARRPERAQDPADLGGKLLRVDRDGHPASDPIPGPPFLLGDRNVQAFDWFDDGRLVVAEHGPSGETGRTGHDEVTLPSPGDNLGWPAIVGCETRAGMRTPAIAWVEANPPGGLAVVRGDALPAWRGDVVLGVLGGEGHLQRLRFDAEGRVVSSTQALRGRYGRLRDVVVGPDGALYVTTSNCDGRGRCGDGDVVLRVAAGGSR